MGYKAYGVRCWYLLYADIAVDDILSNNYASCQARQGFRHVMYRTGDFGNVRIRSFFFLLSSVVSWLDFTGYCIGIAARS